MARDKTKEPWTMAPGHARIAIKNAKGHTIASVGATNYWEDFTDEDMAVARLFLASPDLLAACKVMLEDYQEAYGGKLDEEPTAMRTAKAAIAKAEDQTP